MLERGANANGIDNINNELKLTPLHYLVMADALSDSRKKWTEDEQLSKFQFDFAVLSFRNEKNAISHTIEYAELLINHGADVYAKGHVRDTEVTPLDLATSNKGAAVIEASNQIFFLNIELFIL